LFFFAWGFIVALVVLTQFDHAGSPCNGECLVDSLVCKCGKITTAEFILCENVYTCKTGIHLACLNKTPALTLPKDKKLRYKRLLEKPHFCEGCKKSGKTNKQPDGTPWEQLDAEVTRRCEAAGDRIGGDEDTESDGMFAALPALPCPALPCPALQDEYNETD
jgi:hypothetical protein